MTLADLKREQFYKEGIAQGLAWAAENLNLDEPPNKRLLSERRTKTKASLQDTVAAIYEVNKEKEERKGKSKEVGHIA